MSQLAWSLGADCGETRHYFCLLNPRGRQEASFDVENAREAIRLRLLQLLADFGISAGQVKLVSEGQYGMGTQVAAAGRDIGLSLHQVNPKSLHRYREVEGQPRKDDAYDAFLLARMAFLDLGSCRALVEVEPEELFLRRLSRLQTQLSKRRTTLALTLRSQLLELAPEILQPDWQGPQYSSRGMLAVLEKWPGLEKLERSRAKTLERVLRKSNDAPAKRERQVHALRDLARRLPESLEREAQTLSLSILAAELQMLDRSLREVKARIAKTVQSHPVAQRLLTMPGVGPFVAAVLVGELLALVRNYPEPKVATYAGLTPLSRRSGKSQRDIMPRGTNSFVLHACFCSAVASLKSGPIDRAYYDKKRADYRGHRKAHVASTLALGRQRHKLMYKLMSTDTVYDSELLVQRHAQRVAEHEAEISTDFSTDQSPSPPPAPTSTPTAATIPR